MAGSRQWARRSTAALLIAAVAWPSTAGAASRAAPETAAPATSAREAAPKTEAETKPEPAPEPTPETEPEAKTEPEATPRALAPSDPRPDEATKHWQAGRALYNKGDYAAAAAEFELSYAAVPHATTLYSMGLSYERASMPVEAVRRLRRYVAMPDCSTLPPDAPKDACTEQRREAEQALEDLRPRVGELVLELGEGVKLGQVKVAGRTVPLDDFPLVLLPGTVDVEVFGLRPNERRTRSVTIVGGKPHTLYVAPFEEPETDVRPPETDPRTDRDPDEPVDDERLERRRRALQTTFWVGAGLTAASGVAMAVLGGLTVYHRNEFRRDLCAEVCEDPDAPPYPEDHELAFERYQPVTNALVGVTVGLAVATALVGVFAFRKRPDGGTAGTRARGRAQLRIGASGLVVRW